MKKEEIILKVAEAMQNDVGRGIARIDSKTRSALGVSAGDVILLTGKKPSPAIVWPGHPEDEGLGIIRMDGILRQNVGVGLGDKVTVSKSEIKEASKVILAPRESIRYTPGFDQYVHRRLVGKPIMKGNILPVGVFGTAIPLVVMQTNPSGPVMVTEGTKLSIKPEIVKELENVPTVTYDDVGGLKDTVEKIREMVELPLRHPELFERLGIEPPKGILLFGPPGTGKTLLAKAVANESDASFFYIGGPEVVSKYVGESEQRLRKIFEEAEQSAPSIIFIDEIDAIAPKRAEVTGEVERRMVSQLLTLMDGLKGRGQVIVVAATNRPESIDPALRRPGRFDREIEIGVPDRDGRSEILKIHVRNMPLSEDVDLNEIADVTYGYTGADISALVKESAIKTLRRILPDLNIEEEFIPAEKLEKIKVTREDFFNALREIRPSALREVFIEKPNVRWEDIGGLEKIKAEISEAVELPLKNPQAFDMMGIRPVKGILLFGPPGTGKTLLAKAAATESKANFIAIHGPEVLSKWVGESEKTVREIFRKARQAAPCIIFIDEIDAITPKRGLGESTLVMERVVDTLLTELDGLRGLKGVVVIGATNRPDILDVALMRAGRFDKLIELPIPDERTRLEILKVHTRKMPLDRSVDLKELSKITQGYTGADIENMVREAGMTAIRIGSKNVSMNMFMEAMKVIRASAGTDERKRIEKFKAEGAMYG